jgi:4-hydroxybenzoate polyprenyltransferase
MLATLKHILEMIRFSHTLFALPFALLAAVMAWTAPKPGGDSVGFRWQHLIGIVACMVCARSAAMAFNRIADRKIDAQNPRTKGRHIPAGSLSIRSVWLFTLASATGFVASTLLFLPNPLPLFFSVPVLLFVLSYSYAKRYTALSHFWLGASLMFAPLGVWVALRGELLTLSVADALPALTLGVAVLLWVAGFDMIYACQDVEFDIKAKLYSVPARFGVIGALRLAAACHLGMITALAALPFVSHQLPLGWLYWCGVAAVALLLLYEHAVVKPDDLTRVNIAFFHVNSIVSIGLFLIGTLDLLT